MRRTVLFVAGLIAAGMLAYFGGYYLYVSENPETEFTDPMALQSPVVQSETEQTDETKEYYIAKIEQDMLMIYQMPEKTLYDSIEISSLNFHGSQESQLTEGITFENLTEVFEFLENSMS